MHIYEMAWFGYHWRHGLCKSMCVMLLYTYFDTDIFLIGSMGQTGLPKVIWYNNESNKLQQRA